MKTIKDATSFDELSDIKYGKPGTGKRDAFESKAKAFFFTPNGILNARNCGRLLWVVNPVGV